MKVHEETQQQGNATQCIYVVTYHTHKVLYVENVDGGATKCNLWHFFYHVAAVAVIHPEH